MKTQEELNALKEKLVELSEDELENVAGGKQTTLYDARCKKCGNAIRGSGLDLVTEESAQNKVAQYDKQGCPNCGATNMMEVFSYTIDW